MIKLKKFLMSETVLFISACGALISIFFVPPSKEYIDYIDFRTLALLFCLMLTVSGLSNVGLFDTLAEHMTKKLKNARALCLTLTLMCFFSSMFITNDVALITFVPFTIIILSTSGLKEKLIFTIVLETGAANLGSMLTPVGNPQNLYLYSYYHIAPGEFFCITLPVSIMGLLLLSAACLLCNKQTIVKQQKKNVVITNKKLLLLYILLFVLCLLSVFYLLDYRLLLLLVCVAIGLANRTLFLRADYGLLLTFICFFIFVGNAGKIDSIHKALTSLINGRELISSVLLSQIISNVPTAVLFSGFTDNYQGLLLGTNIGGLGTLVASLASLISFKLYTLTDKAKPLQYLGVFTVINLALLVPLLIFTFLFFHSLG